MDIEQSSDQQSTREVLGNTTDSAIEVASALNEFLKKLAQMGLDKDKEITIRVGPHKVYDGTVGGEGTQNELTETQAKTLSEAFDPAANSGSVRIIDQNNQTLFQSKQGQILKNELTQLQKQTETAALKSEPVVPKPEVSSAKLDLSKGQIPQDLGIPQLKGVDPSKIAEIDRNLAISWGVALDDVAMINESRASVGDNNPAMLGFVKSLEGTRDSIEKQIKDNKYTNEQLLGKPSQTESVTNSQSRDIPSLDNAPSEPNQNTDSQQSSDPPVQADRQIPSQDWRYESPTGKVLDKIDNPPGLSEPAIDPIVFQNQINQEHPQEQAAIKTDPLEELGQISISQSVQIAELQAQLTQVNGKLDELTAWKENITPVKLANERLGNWMNQQRDKVASKVHTLANKIAASASQKFEQVQEQVSERIDQGLEAHHQAVDGLKTQVSEKVEQLRDSLDTQVSQGQTRHNQALAQKGREAAAVFMDKVVNPAVNVLVSQMEKVDAVTVGDDGTKTFQSNAISWNVKPDGSTTLTRNADGIQITPGNATAGEMKAIQSMVSLVDQKYGLTQTQAQSQIQPTTQTQTPKTVQKV